MQRAFRLNREIAQVGQIDKAIGIVAKTIVAVVTTLHYVHGDVGDDEARESRHERTTADMAGSLTGIRAPSPN